MSKLIYVGGYTLSQLRNWITCDGLVGGYYTASSMKAAFAANTTSMAFATNSWIDSRCWTLNVYSGSGMVRVVSPWTTAFATDIYPPQDYAVTSNINSWVTIGALPDVNYSFSYWVRMDPFEIWSYNQQVDYYVPTSGWDNTYRLAAAFEYLPPMDCYTFRLDNYSYWAGVDCSGFRTGGYAYWDERVCLQYIDYGGFMEGICDPNCLIKGTTIEMADGTTKLIEKIRVGDVLKGMKISDAPNDDTIIGWSTDNLNLIETPVRVTGIVPAYSKNIHNFNNGLIESSEDHAHFIKRGDTWLFKKAKDVLIGDFLVDKLGNSIEITSIAVTEGDERKIVYDMNVETEDTFIANGLITHNMPVKQIV